MHADVPGLIELLRRVQDDGTDGRAAVDIVAEWRAKHKKVTDFTDARFFDLELEDVDFSNLDLSGANFGSPVSFEGFGIPVGNEGLINVTGAKFRDAKIDRVAFINCDLRQAVFSPKDSKRSGSSLLFDCCNLTNAEFEGSTLEKSLFSGSDLKHARCQGALFVRCDWIEREGKGTAEGTDFTNATLENCRICLSLEGTNFGQSTNVRTVFDGSNLRAASFSNASLVECSLRGVRVNSRTTFPDMQSTEGCHIDRYTLSCLGRDFGGLSVGNRSDMKIHDDVALLRSQFSGIWMWSHALSIVAFVFPYVWFLVRQRTIARFYSDQDRETSVSLLEAITRYVLRGGQEWNTGDWWIPSWPFCWFLIILLHNVLRAALLFKTKHLETQQEVSGLPAKFALDDAFQGFAVWPGKRLGKGLRFWRWVFRCSRWGFWISLVFIAINSIHFLMMRVPLNLTPSNFVP